MWNKRYATDEYVYGTTPLPFLKEEASHLTPGKALCIGAGEGRNAVWLAERGFETTALDISRVGLEKAEKLARSRGVGLTTETADAAAFIPGNRRWDLITIFYLHLPPRSRFEVYRRALTALAPGGRIILQGFTPRQIGRGTGGPGGGGEPNPADDSRLKFIEPEELKEYFSDLEILRLEEKEIPLVGGIHHTGKGVVVRFVGRKPTES
ncbi:MAG: class I SAM-dependent methyltransferase [Spirochaetaceae bacterium]|nr:class I SAM-dependent methyltransferase [Spirochaetaceae bacterium]